MAHDTDDTIVFAELAFGSEKFQKRNSITLNAWQI